MSVTRSSGFVAAGSPEATVVPSRHHGHPVADAPDLVESVRDVDDPDTFGRQPADHVEERVDLVVVEDRGRLVHDQQADLTGQRPRDGHDLLARRAQ